MKPTIYLAGPMSEFTWEKADKWRREVEETLGDRATCLSPTKGEIDLIPEDRRDVDTIETSEHFWGQHKDINFTASGIYTQDILYLRLADILFVNFLDSTKASQGTMFEMGAAMYKGIPIITVVSEDNVHNTPFVRRSSSIYVPTVEEAVTFLTRVL